MSDTYIASELNGHYGSCQFCGHRRAMLIVVHESHGRINTEYPVRYGDGSMGYDWPERLPARVRANVKRAASLSTYSD